MVGERQVLQGPAEDLSDLLSEVRHADVLANDPCTREFLQAGERLLHDILARDAEEAGESEAERLFYSRWKARFLETL